MNETTDTQITPLTRLLPLACLAAALVLFASELMTMFEFTPPGGEPLDDRSAGESHGNAMFVIAAFAIGALAFAVFAGSKPAAIAVAAMGIVALLFFLLGDLPDAGQVGTLDDARGSFFDAETVPQEGFWLLMVSSLALTVSGIALATLTPAQLAEIGPKWRRGERTIEPDRAAPESAAAAEGREHEAGSEEQEAGRRLGHRPRTRQRG